VSSDCFVVDSRTECNSRQREKFGGDATAIDSDFLDKKPRAQSHFYVGGHYVGAPGKEQMDGAMYVEVWVPKQIRKPYPIVMFHGNGQTGAVWQQTPDGRPGWAYYLIDQGYVVYMVDYPARGRSPYVPGVDGNLGIRTALELAQIWTAPATSGGEFPRKNKYTQWPSNSPKKGMMGDPVFDNFIKGQMQFVTNGTLQQSR
jgi:hypothetical protein